MRYISKTRDIIKNIVLTNFTHPTAEDVYFLLLKEGIKSSVSTVYRNLHQLSEEGIIKEITMPNGKMHYDGQMTDHHHAICVKCNQIYDINTDLVKLDEYLENTIGMKVIDQMIIVRGLCKHCQEK